MIRPPLSDRQSAPEINVPPFMPHLLVISQGRKVFSIRYSPIADVLSNGSETTRCAQQKTLIWIESTKLAYV